MSEHPGAGADTARLTQEGEKKAGEPATLVGSPGSTEAAREDEERDPGERDDRGVSADLPPDAAALWVDVRDLHPWPENPKIITPEHVAEVRESVRLHGWGAPILAHYPSNTIIAGHTRRLAALADLGDDPLWTVPGAPDVGNVPVRYQLVRTAEGRTRFATWEEAEALALADQRTAQHSVWDEGRLARVVRAMHDRSPKLDLTRATAIPAEEVRRLIRLARAPQVGHVPIPLPNKPPRVPKSKVGEVYELGPHRLLCGDASGITIDGERVDAWKLLLLPGERLNTAWTDPPYGVAYVGGNHGVMNPADRKADGGMTIENDEMSAADLRVFLTAILTPMFGACLPGAVWHVAAPQGPLHNVFGDVLGPDGLDVWRRSLTWLKDSFVLGRGDRHYRTEPIFYGWKPGAGHKWRGPTNADNVLIFPRPRSSKYHPTMKPPELVRECVRYATDPEELVGDCCAGSGTTLMAAAADGRIARVIELDPKYVDVIRDRYTRWAEKAGLEPGSGALKLAE